MSRSPSSPTASQILQAASDELRRLHCHCADLQEAFSNADLDLSDADLSARLQRLDEVTQHLVGLALAFDTFSEALDDVEIDPVAIVQHVRPVALVTTLLRTAPAAGAEKEAGVPELF